MNRKVSSILVLSFFTAVFASAAVFEPLPSKAPAPADNPTTAAKVALGKKLYFDPRLSKSGTISCNSCHNVMAAGDDGRAVSIGVGGLSGERSAPTVWNSAFLSVQFWDGRAKSLEEQAQGPLVNMVEMGNDNHDLVLKRIRQIPGYQGDFKKVFGGENSMTIDNTSKAIAAYERTLITPNSAFDKFLKGNKSAISPAAKRGYELVQTVGCVSCHQGRNMAGPTLPEGTGFYQKFPVFPGSEYDKKYQLTKDPGRFAVTKDEADRNLWRVQTWRNVALTAPYFHNGSVKTLEEAVRVMAKTQLNKSLPDNEVADIVAFLNSLSGPFPEQTMPRLPEVANRPVIE